MEDLTRKTRPDDPTTREYFRERPLAVPKDPTPPTPTPEPTPAPARSRTPLDIVRERTSEVSKDRSDAN